MNQGNIDEDLVALESRLITRIDDLERSITNIVLLSTAIDSAVTVLTTLIQSLLSNTDNSSSDDERIPMMKGKGSRRM